MKGVQIHANEPQGDTLNAMKLPNQKHLLTPSTKHLRCLNKSSDLSTSKDKSDLGDNSIAVHGWGRNKCAVAKPKTEDNCGDTPSKHLFPEPLRYLSRRKPPAANLRYCPNHGAPNLFLLIALGPRDQNTAMAKVNRTVYKQRLLWI